jgi:hypothetical protein
MTEAKTLKLSVGYHQVFHTGKMAYSVERFGVVAHTLTNLSDATRFASDSAKQDPMPFLRFFYNGIKAKDGKLQKCSYSVGGFFASSGIPKDTITIYGSNYKRFSVEIQQAFTVENDSDGQTDYFENDRIRVRPDHLLYAAVKAAYDKNMERRERLYQKRNGR